jgi:hypothetical protein
MSSPSFSDNPALHSNGMSLPFLNSNAWYMSTSLYAAFIRHFRAETAKKSFRHKAIEVPFDGFLTATCIRLFRNSDTPQYTLDTLQLQNFILPKQSLPLDFTNMSFNPFPPKTWSVIIYIKDFWCKDFTSNQSSPAYHLHL